MTRPTALVHEAAATARSQPVASALTVLMVMGMIIAVMLTTDGFAQPDAKILSSKNPVTVEIANQPGSPLNISMVSLWKAVLETKMAISTNAFGQPIWRTWGMILISIS